MTDWDGHAVRSVNGVNVTVRNFDDFQGEIDISERRYREVVILDSGWIRCAGDIDDPASGGVAVDHYPPDRVEVVNVVETDDGPDNP